MNFTVSKNSLILQSPLFLVLLYVLQMCLNYRKCSMHLFQDSVDLKEAKLMVVARQLLHTLVRHGGENDCGG
jgi:hypothetical protein